MAQTVNREPYPEFAAVHAYPDSSRVRPTVDPNAKSTPIALTIWPALTISAEILAPTLAAKTPNARAETTRPNVSASPVTPENLIHTAAPKSHRKQRPRGRLILVNRTPAAPILNVPDTAKSPPALVCLDSSVLLPIASKLKKV